MFSTFVFFSSSKNGFIVFVWTKMVLCNQIFVTSYENPGEIRCFFSFSFIINFYFFFLGGGDKYGLPPDPPPPRHFKIQVKLALFGENLSGVKNTCKFWFGLVCHIHFYSSKLMFFEIE